MTVTQLDKYKTRLLELRGCLTDQVNSIEQALRDDVAPPGQSVGATTHNADSAAEGVDEQIILAENEEQMLEDTEAALDRLEAGTYGICENCGQPIARERLDALPQTAWCIKCAAAMADDGRSP